MKRAVLAALLLAGAALPAFAAPPSPLPSLRHLVFHFEFGSQSVSERRIGGAEGSGYGEVTAGQTAKASAGETRKGEIALDVVAATSNGGLVVDVKQDSREKSEPLTRVVIDPDGQLRFLPGTDLSPEEAVLLPLLARDVIGSAVRQKGDTWEIPRNAANLKQSTKYTVVDATPPLTEVVETAGNFNLTGVHPSDGTTVGKVTFNPKFTVPVTASFASHVRNKEPDFLVTTEWTVALSLVSDSAEK